MAFHHRTGAQVLLNSLNSDEQTKVIKEAVTALKNYESHNLSVSPYCMSDKARLLLDESGIPLSSTPFTSHSHPVCKTLENHLLFNVLPSYIKDNSFVIISMKQEKFNLFSARSKLPFLELVNRFVTVKDVVRYSNDYVVHSSKEGFNYRSADAFLSSNSLIPVLKKKVELDPDKRKKNLNIFMHDELHYWGYSELSSFLDLYKPNVIVGTHIFPKEIMKGYTKSVNPTVYQFEIDGDNFHFFPDGKRTECYTQKISSQFLLRARKIITKSGQIYTVSVPYTIFAHSIVIIKRGDFETEHVRFFDQSECLDLSDICKFGTNFSKGVAISTEMLVNMISYLKSLKKPDVQSAIAKLRMFKEDVTGEEIQFITEFTTMLIKNHESNKMITNDWFNNKIADLLEFAPQGIRKFFKCYKQSKMADLLNGLGRVIVRIHTVIFDKEYKKEEKTLETLGKIKKINKSDRLNLNKQGNARYASAYNKKDSKIMLSGLNKAQRVARKEELISKSNCSISEACKHNIEGKVTPGFDPLGTSGGTLNDVDYNGFKILAEQTLLRANGGHMYLTFHSCARTSVYISKNGKKKKNDQKRIENKSEIEDSFVDITDMDFLETIFEKEKYKKNLEDETKGKKRETNEQVEESSLVLNLDQSEGTQINIPTEQSTLQTQEENRQRNSGQTNIMGPIKTFKYAEYNFNDEKYIPIERFNKINVNGDGNCLFHCAALKSGFSVDQLKKIIRNSMNDMQLDDVQKDLLIQELNLVELPGSLSIGAISFALDMGIQVIEYEESKMKCSMINAEPYINLLLQDAHFQLLELKNICVIKCISKIIKRPCFYVMKRIYNSCRHIYHELQEGHGLDITFLGELFNNLGLHIKVHLEGEIFEFGGVGPVAEVLIENNHMDLLDKPAFVDGSHSSKVERNILVPEDKLKSLTILNKRYIIPSEARVSRLYESFLDGYTGVIASGILRDRKTLFDYSERMISFHVGTFGSGKSRGFINFCRANQGYSILVISPRKELANDLIEKMRLSNKTSIKVCTFETALSFMPWSGNLIIIDELQLCPPGYLDLLVAMSNKNTRFIATGDPCQASYDNESDRSIFDEVPTDFEYHMMGEEYSYNATSHRFSNTNFNSRMPANLRFKEPTNESWMFESDIDAIKKSETDAILVSSFGELGYYKKIFKNKRVITFGQSTGLTFERATVVVSRTSFSTDEKRWLVALTRSRMSIIFFFEETLSPEVVLEIDPDHLLSLFMTERASVETLFEKNFLNSKAKIVSSFKIGADEIDREERLQGDPWLKSMIDLAQRPFTSEEEMTEADIKENFGKVHVPIEEKEVYRTRIVDLFTPKERREMRIRNMQSQQFSDKEELRNKNLITNQAQKFESIYPRHRNSDTVTFLMAVKKRLNFSQPRKEMQKYLMNKRKGEEMADAFERLIPIKSNFSVTKFLEAKGEFEKKKLEKSKATITNHAQRSSREWKIDEALIFMKSQLCTKFEKRFVEAKAGQTLACFSHIVLCRFAPYIRYMEKVINENLPENFYIHNGKNFDELNDYVKRHNFNGECIESDYEAFDASQDSQILAFEVAIMRRMNMPQEFIDDYIWLKCNLRSKLGNMAIMRFTGEAATFLFNTMANIVFTIMAYDLKGNECILFAGDDMCMNTVRRANNNYTHILKNLKLKAKVGITKEPTFCGWRLTTHGIYKKPQLILERFMIAIENGNLENCIDNYAIECSYAYKLGDRLVSMFSEEESCAHYILVRYIVKKRNLLKCSVSELFKNCDEQLCGKIKAIN
uniref:RNA-dependent RNA polymerase n=1 Tax=Banana mild mosaic virus TaxID=148879 RepID=A0A8E5NV32_9VIRU|nr:RNA-dependent RNA polymerase [Banmivirus BanMMV]